MVPPGPPSNKVPSTASLLRRGLTGLCPACGAGGQHRWLVRIRPTCKRCGLRFERIEGHFIGAVGMNTIMSLGTLLITLVVSLVVTFPEFPVVKLVVINVAVATLAPILFFPLSRMLWTAIDIAMRPLEPDEVDWTVVYEHARGQGPIIDPPADSGE
ncbi:MAG: DUF983 domain-containing protein [Acidimicrobiia bacterium]|nr:DUF983 domain-containing protein [Acidimicrobiia bacterium]